MGINLTAHQKDEKTGVYHFADVDSFSQKQFFHFVDTPSFKVHSLFYMMLVDYLGEKFKNQVYSTGMYSFSLEEILDVFFRLDAEDHKKVGISKEELKFLRDFFYSCLKNKYSLSIS